MGRGMGNKKEGRAQEGSKESEKTKKGGRNPPSMYFIVYRSNPLNNL